MASVGTSGFLDEADLEDYYGVNGSSELETISPSFSPTKSSSTMIPLEELIERYSDEEYLMHNKAIPILRSTIGIISLLSSLTVIWLIIYRSPQGLSKSTQNRLIFGLCVSDIMYSITTSLFNVMAPNENFYFESTWNARGNATTCDIQGFILTIGFSTGALYTCSLNIYYLAIVKYEKTDNYIKKHLEKYLHIVPIVISVAGSIIVLVNQNLNVDPTGLCWLPVHNPPHCIGVEDGVIRENFEVPCGRGRDTAIIYILLFAMVAASPPIIISVCLYKIYNAVVKLENKLSMYGVGSLRNIMVTEVSRPTEGVNQLPAFEEKDEEDEEDNDDEEEQQNESNVTTSSAAVDYDAPSRNVLCSRIYCACSYIKFFSCFGKKDKKKSLLKDKKSSKSRSVMRKAVAYSISYALTWSLATIFFFANVSGGEPPVYFSYPLAIFSCLQGTYTLVIYIYPKVTMIRKNDKNKSMIDAIIEVFRARKGARHGLSSESSSRPSSNRRSSFRKTKDGIFSNIISRTTKLGSTSELIIDSRVESNFSRVESSVVPEDTMDTSQYQQEKIGITLENTNNTENTDANIDVTNNVDSTNNTDRVV